MKVYLVFHKDGEWGEIILKIFRQKKKAELYKDEREAEMGCSKKMRGVWYGIEEWGVE